MVWIKPVEPGSSGTKGKSINRYRNGERWILIKFFNGHSMHDIQESVVAPMRPEDNVFYAFFISSN